MPKLSEERFLILNLTDCGIVQSGKNKNAPLLFTETGAKAEAERLAHVFPGLLFVCAELGNLYIEYK